MSFNNPIINLTIHAIETTPNQPTRIIQKTFTVPIIVNTSIPSIIFSQSSIPNDINPNSIIGNFTINNITIPHQLELIDSYNNGLELDHDRNTLILRRTIGTLPLIKNQTELEIKVALINETNATILTANFTLRISNPTLIDPCLNKDCGYGTCIHLNEK